MHYYQLHEELKNLFNTTDVLQSSETLGITLEKFRFKSKNGDSVLFGSKKLRCSKHQVSFEDDFVKYTSANNEMLDVLDYQVKENSEFNIIVIKPMETKVASDVIVMFHGLNERKWDKYLPWAYELTKKTNKAVVLFPISFHMDRTPIQWSERRLMFSVAQERAADIVGNSDCSYVNAAISTRMEANPKRMFWSGVQTYHDFVQWVDELRLGKYPSIAANAPIDLFGYSIGSFLSIILLMANPKGILSESKLVCYCGGMTIDRMFPVSKYIMDGRATIMMQKIFAELLTTNFAGDKRLLHYQDTVLHPEESWFKTMLRYNHFQKERECRLKELTKQIYSINLKGDEVAPPVEALNMLQGAERDIAVKVDVVDYPFQATHMVPFPLTVKNAEVVDEHFQSTMQAMADYYNA